VNDPPALLGIYLNDHDAGAVAALELARRCRSSNPDSELGSVLHQFIAEAEEDRATLQQIMRGLGIRRSLVKEAGAWGPRSSGG